MGSLSRLCASLAGVAASAACLLPAPAASAAWASRLADDGSVEVQRGDRAPYRRFFPLGWYGGVYTDTGGRQFWGNLSASDVGEITRNGANFLEIQYRLDGSPTNASRYDRFTAAVGQAHRDGLHVMVASHNEDVANRAFDRGPGTNPRYPEDLIGRGWQQDGILMWSVEDDADDFAFRDFGALQAKVARIKDRARDGGDGRPRLSYVSNTAYTRARIRGEATNRQRSDLRSGLQTWMQNFDAVAFQGYAIDPLGDLFVFEEDGPSTKKRNPLSHHYKLARAYVDAAEDARGSGKDASVIANIQAHRIARDTSRDDYGRFPTPEEVRNMFWSSLSAGVNGVIFYAWKESNAAVQGEAQALFADAKRIQNRSLLTGTHRRIGLGDPNFLGGCYWVSGKTLTAVFVNHDGRDRYFEWRPPAAWRGASVTSRDAFGSDGRYERRPSYRANRSRVAGNLRANGVCVLELQRP